MDKVLGKNRRITILDTKIDVLDMKETVSLVETYISEKEPLHLMGVNADKINEIQKDAKLKKIVNGCGIINADGASVVLASKYLNMPLPERVAGIDLMQELIDVSAARNYKIYLLGAKPEVVSKTAEVLLNKHPNLNIVGIHHGYIKREEWKRISNDIMSAAPDICFVGITSPMKEYIIEFLQDEGHKCVFMGVGGSFDVISGKLSRAPEWMQRLNLEWFFRMMQEPQRLFKRYFFGNAKFISAVIKERRRIRGK